MTALFITADSIGSPTGGGLVCHHETEALRALGFDLIALSQKDLSPERYSMPASPFLFDYLALEQAQRRFGSTSTKPRLVHFYSGTFTCTVRYFKALGVPISYTVDAHDRAESIQEFQTIHGDYPFPHVKEPHIWNLYCEGVAQADIAIAPSTASEKALAEQGCRRIEIVPHGTDLPLHAPPLPTAFAAGYLGQPGPDKGLRYLVRAWGACGFDDADLFIAGDNSEHLGPVVTANADRGRFELLGRVPRPSDLYERVSVYVQPSVTEGFGIEIIEAMAHGRPVIVSEGAGGADAVTEGEDGFVVPRRDPAAIARHLRWFRDNPHKMVEMGARARHKAARFSWEKVRRRYVDVWRTLIG